MVSSPDRIVSTAPLLLTFRSGPFYRDSRAAVLALADSGGGLAQAIMELIREIEARGLP